MARQARGRTDRVSIPGRSAPHLAHPPHLAYLAHLTLGYHPPGARLLLGVLIGYAVFAVAAVAMFAVPGRDPHAAADPTFMVATIGGGIIAAVAAGYVAAVIARRHERVAGLVVAAIITLGATASLVASPGAGARWSQWAALLMSPAAWLSSIVRARAVGR